MQIAGNQTESNGMDDAASIARKLPTHELVYRQIREMILFGELAPGQPVTIQGLVETLETGITPVREAIRRLTAENALVAKGNRRISVPSLTLQELEELSFARLTIEPQLAKLATKSLNSEDIQQLEEIDDAVDIAIAQGNVRAYLEQNYRFHHKLYGKSQAHILLSIANALWLRVGPSLRVVCGRYGTFNLPDKHEEALAAMKAGDSDAVANAIREDIEQGHVQVQMSFRDD